MLSSATVFLPIYPTFLCIVFGCNFIPGEVQYVTSATLAPQFIHSFVIIVASKSAELTVYAWLLYTRIP